MSASDYELRRLESNIADLHKELEENERMEKRNDDREQWELDRLKREFEVRKRGFQQKTAQLNQELKAELRKRDKVQYELSIQKNASDKK